MATRFSLFMETVREWSEDRASRLAAALAFHATFSIAPILVIVIALTSVVFGEESASFLQDVIERGRSAVSSTYGLRERSQSCCYGFTIRPRFCSLARSSLRCTPVDSAPTVPRSSRTRLVLSKKVEDS